MGAGWPEELFVSPVDDDLKCPVFIPALSPRPLFPACIRPLPRAPRPPLRPPAHDVSDLKGKLATPAHDPDCSPVFSRPRSVWTC
jgi:hypothetical protein